MSLPLCENDGRHDGEPPYATVRMSWPDGRFVPAHACDSCAIWSIEVYVLEDFEDGAQHPVLVEPLTDGAA